MSTLGRRLEAGGESERLRHSRLLLAETLLSRRHGRPMDEHLIRLPLLRAIRLPKDREEAWSIADLRRQIENRRVFVSPSFGGFGLRRCRTEPNQHGPSDPKRAVMELAKALDEAVWMVSRDAVSSVADAPVTHARGIGHCGASKPNGLPNLPVEHSSSSGSRRAFQTTSLFAWPHVCFLPGVAQTSSDGTRSCFHGRPGNRRALHILLRLLDRSWCAVQGGVGGFAFPGPR